MYRLCEIYLSFKDEGSNRKRDEFITVNDYNIVFEDMVDKLLSDEFYTIREEEIPIDHLRKNDDGKLIDHLYSDQSLFDSCNIFHIGDSKYYKSGSYAGSKSRFKQFTYAKNIIQKNLNIFHESGERIKNVRYRDKVTEGYNVTPNFFIYGYIQDFKDFDNDHLMEKGKISKSFHFEDRLFDRDTLFVHQYQINFLYVLKSYSQFGATEIKFYRKQVRDKFRRNFIEFFNDPQMSSFNLFIYNKLEPSIEDFVEANFRKLNGKCFRTEDEKLVLAQHTDDKSLDDFLGDFEKLKL